MLLKPVESKRSLIFDIHRENLEDLVLESKAIRARKPLKNFYDNDMHAIRRLQEKHDFLMIGLKKFHMDDKSVTFFGKKLDGNILIGNDVEVVVNDLGHITCVRFAYATYQLINMNRERYLISRRFDYSNPGELKNYFRKRLQEYFRHER